jgi:acyl carrier protein
LLENYFDLGGDSLAAVEISLHIEEAFQVQVNMQDIIEHPNVAELASYIDRLASGGRAPQPEEDLPRSLRMLGY